MISEFGFGISEFSERVKSHTLDLHITNPKP
jgi:hypothetical protein